MCHHEYMSEGSRDANASSVPALVAGLSEMQSLLVGTDAIDEVVWETAMLAVRASDVVDECGVTVLREGRPRSLFPSSASHGGLEEHQYSSGDGPAMEAINERAIVLGESMADEVRWGSYPAQAREQGIGSCLSIPLVAGDQVLGAINYYSARSYAFPEDFLLGRLVADLASTGLWCLLKHADREAMDEQLQQAVSSRASIDQAKGIVMERERCGSDDAFDLLRRVSQNRNVKLRDVAAKIVSGITDAN